ncbi:unnamed protein product [Closterium sp. NIES-54]
MSAPARRLVARLPHRERQEIVNSILQPALSISTSSPSPSSRPITRSVDLQPADPHLCGSIIDSSPACELSEQPAVFPGGSGAASCGYEILSRDPPYPSAVSGGGQQQHHQQRQQGHPLPLPQSTLSQTQSHPPSHLLSLSPFPRLDSRDRPWGLLSQRGASAAFHAATAAGSPWPLPVRHLALASGALAEGPDTWEGTGGQRKGPRRGGDGHIGAFKVQMPSGAALTFLDTPGHAAFAAMRARGAAVTDIVVLVVAADDGVMPQTLESIQHARSAGVPMVVAITKCDKEGADPNRVTQQLISEGLELEEIGGDVQVVRVSARTRSGLETLEEAVALQAELMDLRGREAGEAEAVVIEARMARGKGPLASVIVKGGRLRSGMYVVVGKWWGRVRSLKGCRGESLKEAGPSTPVEIDGLKGVPEAGDSLMEVVSEARARRISEARQEASDWQRLLQQQKATSVLQEQQPGQQAGQGTGEVQARGGSAGATANSAAAAAAEKAGAGMAGEEQEQADDSAATTPTQKEVVLVLKGDVQGSVEAVGSALEHMGCERVRVRVVHAEVGAITQSDVDMAEATGAAAIVGFNVRCMGAAVDAAAKQADVPVGGFVCVCVCERVRVRVVHAEVGAITQSDIDMAEATGAAAIEGFNVRCMGAAVDAAAKQADVPVGGFVCVCVCERVRVRVVHAEVGAITQSDIDMAEATGAAAIVGFNVRCMGGAVDAAAKQADVPIRLHRVIYHLLEDIGGLVVQQAPTVRCSVVTGQAQVLQLFPLKGKSNRRSSSSSASSSASSRSNSGSGGGGGGKREGAGGADESVAEMIAGCKVTEGKFQRGAKLRVLRSGEVVYEGLCASLRRERADVDAVNAGVECGVVARGWGGFRVGDVVQVIGEREEGPRLVSLRGGGMRIEYPEEEEE